MAWIRTTLWPRLARSLGLCETWDSMQAVLLRRAVLILMLLALLSAQSAVYFSLGLKSVGLGILVVATQYAGMSVLPVLLLVLVMRWAKRCKLAAGKGGFVCPRCEYDLDVPLALDIDPTSSDRRRTVGTKTRVFCPECGLETTASEVLKHWKIGPFDPRAVWRRRGFFWPLVRRADPS